MEKLGELISAKQLQDISILDIGGTTNYWAMNLKYLPKGMVNHIDVVNLPPYESQHSKIDGVSVHAFAGDALKPETFSDTQYDLVHSNSVIEHVGNLPAQAFFARSVYALGDYHWIQAPAKSFPLEPHFYFPYFAYLPLSVKSLLVRNFNMGFYPKEAEWLKSRILCEGTRLPTKKEFERLFAKSVTFPEKVLFFSKSYIATNLINEEP